MHDLKVSSPRTAVAAPPARGRLSRLPGRGRLAGWSDRGLGWLHRDSMAWLAGVAVLYLAAEMTPALLRVPLGTDEITYIATMSVHASGVTLPPVHGQGAGLLAAPMTLITSSLLAIRIWMAVLSAAGLFAAMACWRGLRPLRIVALIGLIFGSLAIAQDSGVQIYPDWWGALALLALTGLLLHAVRGTMRSRLVLPLIAVASMVIVLMRPQNLVFLLGPAVLAVIVVPGWRQPKVLAAMAAGTALGVAEWVIGAFVWYGGLAARLHGAGQEPPKLSLYFSLTTQVKVLSGPWYCVPPQGCQGWVMPGEEVWWALFLGVAVLGLVVAWRTGRTALRSSSLFAAVTAAWVFVLYVFLVPFGAPRYILPSLALMAVLAADAVTWLVTRAPWRRTGVAIACLFLVSGIVSQRFVLEHEAVAEQGERPFLSQAEKLRVQENISPPCAVSSPPVAYYLGCTAPWTGEPMSEVLGHTRPSARGWGEELLPDGSTVYVAP